MTTTTLFHILSYNNRPFTPLFYNVVVVDVFCHNFVKIFVCVLYMSMSQSENWCRWSDDLLSCMRLCFHQLYLYGVLLHDTCEDSGHVHRVLVTCMVSFFVFPSLDLITAPVRITLGHTDIQRVSWHKNKLFQDELKQR